MTGDFSRFSGDPRRAFAGVRMQQGRVALDADWNEQSAILDRRLRSLALDVLGRRGVPAETPEGFRIAVSRDGAQRRLWIGRGRYYLDGLQAENFGAAPFGLDAATARPGARGPAGVLDELLGSGAVEYRNQPFWPAPDPLPASDGPHLVYLDVWRREVTAIEDPALLEKALGGVDTTTRTQTVWQVRVLPNVGEDVSCATPPAEIPGWTARTQPSGARLTTRLGTAPAEEEPCRIAVSGGYRGLENQLYRVEIHDGGAAGTATFKWSRDNATVAATVQAVLAPDLLTLSSTGRDALLGFGAGDWVEVTDDRRELAGLPGELRQLRSVDHDSRRVTLSAALPSALLPSGGTDTPVARRTRIRRWDQARQVRDAAGNTVADLDAPGARGAIVVPPAGTAIRLENGIEVLFETTPGGGPFRPGDHWCFAARSIDASVEILDRAPPRGIHHHYAPLALIRWPADAVDQRTRLLPQGGRIEVCAAVHAGPGGLRSPVEPGEEIPVAALGAGIEILLRQDVTAASVNDGTLLVSADLPFAPGPAAYGSMPASFGFVPVVLPGRPELTGPGRLRWRTDQDTLDYLSGVIARGVPRIGTARFETSFDVFPHNQQARFRTGPGNAVLQEGSGAVTPGAQAVLPMLAVLREPLRSAPLFATLVVEGVAQRTAGLVYNWRAPGDFMVFYGTHLWQPIGFSGAISVVRMGLVLVRGGQPAQQQEVQVSAGQSEPARYTLDLRFTGNRLQHGCTVTTAAGVEIARSADLGFGTEAMQPGTRIGLADRRSNASNSAVARPTVFSRLSLAHADGRMETILPLGTALRLLARVTLKRSLLALPEAGAFPPPVPEPDWETWFWLTGAGAGSYGYGYGQGAWQGIGAGLLR